MAPIYDVQLWANVEGTARRTVRVEAPDSEAAMREAEAQAALEPERGWAFRPRDCSIDAESIEARAATAVTARKLRAPKAA